MGPLRVETLTLVLAATVVGAQRPRRQSECRPHGTSDIPGLYGRPPTILILAGAPQAHPGLSGPLWATRFTADHRRPAILSHKANRSRTAPGTQADLALHVPLRIAIRAHPG